MKRVTRSGGAVSLLEFLITFFAFAISCVFILRLFAQTSTLQQRAKELDAAVVCAQSAAERLKSCDGTVDGAMTLFPSASGEGMLRTIGYDDDWCVTADASPAYSLKLSFAETYGDNGLLRCDIAVYRGDEPLYELPFVRCFADSGTKQISEVFS